MIDLVTGRQTARSAASPGAGSALAIGVRKLSRGPSKVLRFAYDFEDAAALFGGRLIIAADPGKLIWQFPYELETPAEKLDPSRYFLGAGDWSGSLLPIEKSPIYLQAVQLKEAGFAFRRTPIYRRLRKVISGGETRMLNNVELDTVEKLDAYFRNYRNMLMRARKHGIRRRPPVILDGGHAQYRVNGARPLWAELSERDVGIAIDRDGRLHRIGPGKHRTAAAKVLGLERMPCEVRMVHVDWLTGRVPQPRNPGQLIRAIRSLGLSPTITGAVP